MNTMGEHPRFVYTGALMVGLNVVNRSITMMITQDGEYLGTIDSTHQNSVRVRNVLNVRDYEQTNQVTLESMNSNSIG